MADDDRGVDFDDRGVDYSYGKCGLTFGIAALAALAHRQFRAQRHRSADADVLAAHPSVRREMAKKAKLRATASARAATQASVDGLPAGQHAAKKWIVLDLGLRPAPGSYSLEPDAWKLVIVVPSGRSAT